MSAAVTVEAYIASFPDATQVALGQVRQAVKELVPDAAEVMNYGIPTFQIGGKNMVHYGGYANHIGFYATPDGHDEFEPELAKYKRGKGSVQFPLDQPMPLELVRRIALYRAAQLRK